MKKIIITICCLLGFGTISAQRLGMLGGIQMTNTWALAGKCEFNPHLGLGFTTGAIFDYNFSQRFGFEAGLLYNMRRTTFDIDYNHAETTVHFRRTHFYLDIPLHLYVDFPMKKNVIWAFFAGPSVNVALHGKDIAWENTPQQKPVAMDNENIFGNDKRTYRLQIAAGIGTAIKYTHFEWRLGYNVSLNNMTVKEFLWFSGMTYAQNKYLRDGNLTFSFAYLFDLKRK